MRKKKVKSLVHWTLRWRQHKKSLHFVSRNQSLSQSYSVSIVLCYYLNWWNRFTIFLFFGYTYGLDRVVLVSELNSLLSSVHVCNLNCNLVSMNLNFIFLLLMQVTTTTTIKVNLWTPLKKLNPQSTYKLHIWHWNRRIVHVNEFFGDWPIRLLYYS